MDNENDLRVQKTATSTGVTKYTLYGKNIVHMPKSYFRETVFCASIIQTLLRWKYVIGQGTARLLASEYH